MSGIPTEWLKTHHTPQDRARVEQLLRNSTAALSLVYNLLSDRERELNIVKTKDYDNPSWAFLQAHKNGSLQQLAELKRLLEFIKP